MALNQRARKTLPPSSKDSDVRVCRSPAVTTPIGSLRRAHHKLPDHDKRRPGRRTRRTLRRLALRRPARTTAAMSTAMMTQSERNSIKSNAIQTSLSLRTWTEYHLSSNRLRSAPLAKDAPCEQHGSLLPLRPKRMLQLPLPRYCHAVAPLGLHDRGLAIGRDWQAGQWSGGARQGLSSTRRAKLRLQELELPSDTLAELPHGGGG